MNKRVYLITGTPGVGKTTIASRLAAELSARYINLTDYALKQGFILGQDLARKTVIIDENKVKSELKKLIETSEDELFVVDGHFSPPVVPQELVKYVFVLRRNPIELRQYLQKREYNDNKVYENLASEILDVCLTDALNFQSPEKICEIDMSLKEHEDCFKEILAVINGKRACGYGTVDWLGMLEKENLLEEYLRI